MDADAVPGYRVYEDETGTPLLTGSMALLDDANTLGFYSEQITLSAANGFELGKSYCIRTTIVVSGVTGVDLQTFQMGSKVDVRMLAGGVQSATDLKDFADDGYDPSTNKVQGVVLTDTVTTYTGNTPQTGDAYARLGAPSGASVSADILTIDNLVDDLESRLGTPSDLGSGATIAANLVDIEGQTDDIGAAGAGLTAVPWNASWDAEVQSEVEDGLIAKGLDHLVSTSVAGADVADDSIVAKMVSKSATADWDSFTNTTDALEAIRDNMGTAQTGDAFARLGAPAGASVSADILAVDNLVDDLESRLGTPSDLGSGATVAANLVDIEGQTDDIGVAGAGLSAVPWNSAWDAEVQSEVDDALVARNLDKIVLASGTADSGSTTTMVDAARTEADADYWKGRLLVFTSGNVSGQCAIITDFNQTTDTFTFAPPLTQAVATQNYVILPGMSVWDDTLAEHLISGSTGAALNAAGSAGDPWATALPGAYGAGTAGKIIGDNINATISSRASQTSVDTVDDFLDTEIAAIKAKTDNLPTDPADQSAVEAAITAAQLTQANVRTAVGLASANLDTQLGDLPTNAELATALSTADDAVLAAIAALNNLSQANIRTAIGLASANLDTQLDALPTNAELATALSTADDAVLAAIAALNNLSAAQVNAEVLDVLSVDTFAQPGQGTPAATTSLQLMIAFLYKAWRNKTVQSASQYSLYNDDTLVVDQKATFSDDGTSATTGEIATGP